ncbi:hypothetical protein [Actinophytocola glycyrrhizae]|uniref:PPE family protein n=1 Tax=Actinophytocola glycyrrhizae TaxID=2044873 RepID=A0ABV9RSK2_9PSEU
MSPHAIYEYFATGRGTGALDDAQAATRTEWEAEDERAHLIRKQGELIRSGWQGAASDGAFGAAQPLAESALEGAALLSRAEDLLDRQSGSFHRAANSVTPVPEEPPGMDLNDPMVVFTDYEAEVKAYQADAHHNMEIYRGYDGASEYNQTNMPAEYSTVNHAGGTISVTSDDGRSAATGDFIEVREHEEPGNGSESGPYNGSGWPGGSPVSGPPVSGPPVSGPVPNPSLPPQQTTPSDYVPPAINTPGGPPPAAFHPAPAPGQAGFVPGLPGGGFTGGAPGGPEARGGTYGPGARGGAYGGGAGGNAGPGAGARGGVPGPGAGTGAIAAEEAAARRAAAAAAARGGAAAGPMGGAPMGAGRGKGDEDDEYKRKVLIETDAEGLFGSDELTAPQVIGDDEYEDD